VCASSASCWVGAGFCLVVPARFFPLLGDGSDARFKVGRCNPETRREVFGRVPASEPFGPKSFWRAHSGVAPSGRPGMMERPEGGSRQRRSKHSKPAALLGRLTFYIEGVVRAAIASFPPEWRPALFEDRPEVGRGDLPPTVAVTVDVRFGRFPTRRLVRFGGSAQLGEVVARPRGGGRRR
jgi:hypothetical protein